MKTSLVLCTILLLTGCARLEIPPRSHPDTAGAAWQPLFDPSLSNAIDEARVWSVDGDDVLTSDEDELLWTSQTYDDFILDLEFRNEAGTNSGVFLHADLDDYVASSIEVQIADDFSEPWSSAPATWQSGAIFGHSPPARSAVRPPGAWNRMTITTRGDMVWVLLNGELVNEMDMSRWTSATINPDGSEIPEWLNRPVAEIPRQGHIGLQGKHAGAPIYFRNIRIREIR